MSENIDQQRAKYAYIKVKDVVQKQSDLKKKYSAKAVKFPAMILANGLPQALLFLFSKENDDDKSYRILLSHIRGWFAHSGADELRLYTCSTPTNEAFVEHVIEAETAILCLITTETLSLANWLKRFAEGMIGKGAE
ncbi:type III-B CRISPR module-associated protein Cmr5 [Dehalococcoidia bacterium]|nr:type III-B CRISPR module-associated protein Cmr5 [Dehalococcoidia bacterium]MCL0098491.1 type III-B CRISPR module-associated protein Cmr5 [Dehalococcoidia bacterium]